MLTLKLLVPHVQYGQYVQQGYVLYYPHVGLAIDTIDYT